MAFYNPLSPSTDIGGGIVDLLNMILQYMMIQKMYPPQGASEMARTGGAGSTGMLGMTSPRGLNLNPLTQMGGMPQTGGMGGLDMNSIMQLLMQLFSRPSNLGFPGGISGR